MRTGKWTSILPAIIAKEVYRLFNPRTGLPIQKESNAHRKQLNVFELRYYIQCVSMDTKVCRK